MSLNVAIKEAKKARHHQHKLGAVLMRGGKPIEVAHNFAHVHAEHAVLNKAWRTDVDGATLLIIRMRKNGTLGMAKPCELCMQRLAQAGIKKVTYSTSNGKFETIKLTAIPTAVHLEYHFIKPRAGNGN